MTSSHKVQIFRSDKPPTRNVVCWQQCPLCKRDSLFLHGEDTSFPTILQLHLQVPLLSENPMSYSASQNPITLVLLTWIQPNLDQKKKASFDSCKQNMKCEDSEANCNSSACILHSIIQFLNELWKWLPDTCKEPSSLRFFLH